MLGREQRKAKTLLGLSDILVTALAFEAALLMRRGIDIAQQFVFPAEQKTIVLGFSVIVLVLTGYLLNVYGKIDSARLPTIVRDSLRQTAYCAALLVMLVFALKLAISRLFLLVFIGILGFLLIGFRVALRNLVPVVRRHFGVPRYILIAGTGPRARRFAGSLEPWRDHGIRILGFLACEDGSRPLTLQLSQEYPVFPPEDLPSILRREVLDEICFAVEPDQFGELEEAWLACREQGVCSRIAVDFFGQENCPVSLERFGGTSLLTFSAAPDDEILLFIKRLIDIGLASSALFVLSPLLLFVALLIKFSSRGPVIFKQTRCGLNGRIFTLYKFRSMVADAERRIAEVAHLNTKKIVTKIPNDPRLTPVGRWLRKFSLDELPQLVNILRGDMSLVGPRPAIPSEVAHYKRWQRRRLRMRPGLTCLWAVNGRDTVDFDSWMQLDMSYIDNWSLALDTKIILKTIPQVISGRGAS